MGFKKIHGKEYMGINRTTFVIDENGIIEDIISKVNTKIILPRYFKVILIMFVKNIFNYIIKMLIMNKFLVFFFSDF